MNWRQWSIQRGSLETLLLFCHMVIIWRKTDITNVGANISAVMWKRAASCSPRQLVRIAPSRLSWSRPTTLMGRARKFLYFQSKLQVRRENTGAWYPLIPNTSEILMPNLRYLLCDREKNSVGCALLKKPTLLICWFCLSLLNKNKTSGIMGTACLYSVFCA